MGKKKALFVDDYLPALLARASTLISSEFHAIARANGVSVSEWRLLASLSSEVPLSVGELAQITITKQPTVTRILDRMQARGYVERIAGEDDRRMTLIHITPSGKALASALIVHAKEHESRVLEPFGLGRARELKAVLRRLIELHQ